MKSVEKLLVLSFFAACVMTFTACKKDAAIPTLTTTEVTPITETTATSGGTVNSSGGVEVTARGVCWSTDHNPTVAGNKTMDGNGTGSFTSSITGLTANTVYYVRAYATNSAGTAYGNEISFNSHDIPASVTTTNITSITSFSAVSGGTLLHIQSDLLLAYGVCWSTSSNPTINDSQAPNESGELNFTSTLTDLTQGTTYYVRAFAVYENGPVIYGNELSFRTSSARVSGTKKADFPGGSRYSVSAFSIGTKVYMGLGFDDNEGNRNDFWEWDQATDLWTKKADYPGNSTGADVCFSIGTKGYVGSGNNNSSATLTNEFWEYDPATNTWTQKASLPGTPSRIMAVGFSIGTKGYVGTGYVYNGGSGSNFKDFWEWDQATNIWTRKADFGGMARYGAVGFSIGTKGYIGTGFGGAGGSSLFKDFWEWDQATDTWTRKADFGGAARAFAVGFSTGTKGYIGNGYDGSDPSYKDYWEWDQGTDEWIRIADFEGDARVEAFGVTIGNKGYIGTGIGGPGFLNDFWEYDPNLK
jgi:hypothetical protein